MQYDESETLANLDQVNQLVRQENDAQYATITLGADYFISDDQTAGWFFEANASWYQEFSSSESISLVGGEQFGSRANIGFRP